MAVVGLLSRIVVRKMGRRTGTAEAKQTLPVAVSVCDGEAGNNTDHGDVSAVAAEADAAREQFPFIFNLLRGHAINSQAVGPGPRLAGQLSADSRRSKTSAHHQHHQQLQQQAGKPAVTTCRQHQATPTGKGTYALIVSAVSAFFSRSIKFSWSNVPAFGSAERI